MKPRGFPRTGVVLASTAFALVACAEAPQPNASLSEAQQAYATASADPVVRQAAPRELENAQESLNTAQDAWQNDEDKATVDHYAYLARRYSEVAQQAAKVRTAAISATTSARVMTLGDMLFATGKADLNANGMKAVTDLATFLHHYPDRIVAIMGYTDSTGSAKLNAALSEQRAAAVQQALVAQGIDASRIQAKGLGESNPVASNKTANGRQQNRRVEVAISGVPATVGMGSSSAPR